MSYDLYPNNPYRSNTLPTTSQNTEFSTPKPPKNL
ncbi:hypothetical protein PENCOP_c027G04796 [Penicillium coprophilum]|uniref:Uncharacterized protein n=1 Tax=Penicillium coprophilum TaxID=36646 RepID=A0A1V6U770_9EURO|nr:hypothetical protein PENCOP_c027G04796 [Penicillium coprophilum]